MYRILFVAAILAAALAPAARAQQPAPVHARPIELAGPRIGVTAMFGPVADSLRGELGIAPFITQFGWQVEHRFYAGQNGLAGLTELVMLVGGMEQGEFIPSVSGLVGLRTGKGTEVGVGPTLSPAGIGLAFAGGVTVQSGGLNFPVNLAVVPARNGTRISLLTGFNMERAGSWGGIWGL